MQTPEEIELREKVISSLLSQGYTVDGLGRIIPPTYRSKDDIRLIHKNSVAYQLEKKKMSLERYEDKFINRIANGEEVSVSDFYPKIIPVHSGTADSYLFNYISCHWSVPVSSGYGRRMRYLVEDESNKKIVGIIGLGDPIYGLEARDNYIGWTSDQRKEKLYNIMEAYVLGAVPPYNRLLCGKLMALLSLSDTVRYDFKEKYQNRTPLISGRKKPANLVSITTTSALGVSSVYDRIKANGFEYWHKIGFTKGTGNFQFSNSVYLEMIDHVRKLEKEPEKNERWGKGFRNRREVVRKCLKSLDLNADLMEHGVKREIYMGHLCENSRAYLNGSDNVPLYYDWGVEELADLFKTRWMIPRAKRFADYKGYDREGYRLWVQRES